MLATRYIKPLCALLLLAAVPIVFHVYLAPRVEALSLDDSCADGYEMLGRCYLEKGKLSAARRAVAVRLPAREAPGKYPLIAARPAIAPRPAPRFGAAARVPGYPLPRTMH